MRVLRTVWWFGGCRGIPAPPLGRRMPIWAFRWAFRPRRSRADYCSQSGMKDSGGGWPLSYGRRIPPRKCPEVFVLADNRAASRTGRTEKRGGIAAAPPGPLGPRAGTRAVCWGCPTRLPPCRRTRLWPCGHRSPRPPGGRCRAAPRDRPRPAASRPCRCRPCGPFRPTGRCP